MTGNDIIQILIWYFMLLIIGIISYPFTKKLLKNFGESAWLFSKAIGIVGCGFIMWIFASLRVCKFSARNCIAVTVIWMMVNAIVFVNDYKDKKEYKEELSSPIKKREISKLLWVRLRNIIFWECLFLCVLMLWCYIRSHFPAAFGEEKFMDFGFMKMLERTDYFPPEDLWYAGEPLNYYYFGQYLATFLTKLSFQSVEYTYNLMLTTVAALGILLPSIIGFQLSKGYWNTKGNGKKNRIIPRISGAISGLAVGFAGNMHYPLFRFVVPFFQKEWGVPEEQIYNFWFPDSTRYIGFFPETADETIHEFPVYSYIIGDLHAHMVNTIFVFLFLACIVSFAIDEKKKNGLRCLIDFRIIYVSFLLGIFWMTNSWDYPIYITVAVLVFIFVRIKEVGVHGHVFASAGLLLIGMIAISKMICLPFSLSFSPMIMGIEVVEERSKLYQLLILWGLPAFIVFLHVRQCFIDAGKAFKENIIIPHKDSDSNCSNLLKRIVNAYACLSYSEVLVAVLGLCAIGLVLIPEFVYVKDIYEGSKRANTMFKLTYQAFIMFGICMGVVIPRAITEHKHGTRRAGIISALCFLMTIGYSFNAVANMYGYTAGCEEKGLSASHFLSIDNPGDYEAIQWLNENVKGVHTILEASGYSYSTAERISVFTGLPTVIGWDTHEWLWRCEGSTDKPNGEIEREEDVYNIFCSNNLTEKKTLISKYDIEYIIVGDEERNTYEYVDDELMKMLGSVVFEYEKGESSTYIIRIE